MKKIVKSSLFFLIEEKKLTHRVDAFLDLRIFERVVPIRRETGAREGRRAASRRP